MNLTIHQFQKDLSRIVCIGRVKMGKVTKKTGTRQSIRKIGLIDPGRVVSIRGIGTSTAIALEFIAECIRNPLIWKVPRDHHPSKDAQKHLQHQVADMIQQLGLSFDVEFRHGVLKFRAKKVGSYIYEDGRIERRIDG